MHKVLVGKPEGQRPLGRPRRGWEDNIKMVLQELGRGCGDWMELPQDRGMRWAGHVARIEEGRGVHKVLVGKPDGKRPLGRPRRRWDDNIKMDLEEVGRGCVDWMELAKDRDRWRALVSTVMNFGVVP